jgi:hypothetical protein
VTDRAVRAEPRPETPERPGAEGEGSGTAARAPVFAVFMELYEAAIRSLPRERRPRRG